MKKFILFFIIFSLMNISAIPQSKEIFKKFYWLEGNWENTSEKKVMFENWKKVNDTLLTGESFTIKNDDTTSYESVRIELINNAIYFIPVVRNQNEGQAVLFKLISYGDEAIFENKDHDFPQRVIYSFNGSDSLNARIEGEMKGSYKRIPFNYKKKNIK